VAKGEFKGGLRSFGIAEQGVGYVSEGPHGAAIPAWVKDRIAELSQRIARGEIRIPSR
jgi:basic membrane protein A and related proteins